LQAHIHFGPPAINGGIRRSGRKSASGCVVTDLSQCIDAGGGPWLFFAGGNAYQDSSFFATGLAAEGSATVSAPLNMPGECGPGTSEGLARSVFSAVFSTDQAYRVTVDDLDTFRNASLTLTHDTGSGPALLYSVAGTVPVGYDEVVGAGVFNLFIQAESDEHLEDSNFNVLLGLEDPPPPVPGAGRVSQLVLGKSTASPQLQLAWQPSCSFDDDTYAIFGGDLGFFDSHTPGTCSTGGATAATLAMPAGDRYYLVVPMDGTSEGSYGTGAGVERPVGVPNCGTQFVAGTCP